MIEESPAEQSIKVSIKEWGYSTLQRSNAISKVEVTYQSSGSFWDRVRVKDKQHLWRIWAFYRVARLEKEKYLRALNEFWCYSTWLFMVSRKSFAYFLLDRQHHGILETSKSTKFLVPQPWWNVAMLGSCLGDSAWASQSKASISYKDVGKFGKRIQEVGCKSG